MRFLFSWVFACTFSFGKLFTALQKFSKLEFFAVELDGLHRRHDAIRNKSKTVEQHRVYHVRSACCLSTDGLKITTPRPPNASRGRRAPFVDACPKGSQSRLNPDDS